ncbi:DUF3566 domain-containing protein [Bifidobacterium leontopitheci]|uniref:DUF3566 domain-containing protein n=1 Tax=Bifidobacterium leontopitheci TaxID=2650774 RepID=A0A6I1GQJ5_9BIFI|nr:DUF3566 domain-containing protein [Bifidobacterium leontopitheci]KAB7790368.1 hypothetical protein F7D09_1124 [Bifidobacterium leontopitheci]
MSENFEHGGIGEPPLPGPHDGAEAQEGARPGGRRVARSISNHPLPESEPRVAAATAEPRSGGSRPVRRGTPRARRMNLSLTHINAWSVAKMSFMLSIAGAIIQVIATLLVWLLMDAVGVFDQLNQIVKSTGLNTGTLDLQSVFSLSTVLSVVTILAIVGVVLVTLLATIVALLYNVVSSLVGGVHITLGDD